jgi:hypothetical protein
VPRKEVLVKGLDWIDKSGEEEKQAGKILLGLASPIHLCTALAEKNGGKSVN